MRYSSCMSRIDAALWGLFGSFAATGLDFRYAVHRHGCWPWNIQNAREVGAFGYCLVELMRLGIGAGLASAAAASGQLPTEVGALAVGIAAPMIVEHLARWVPLTELYTRKKVE